jgi:hypothetical protein
MRCVSFCQESKAICLKIGIVELFWAVWLVLVCGYWDLCMLEPNSSEDVKSRFQTLIEDATSTAPVLTKRLHEIWRWIKDKKPGQLMSKRHVLDFLYELDRDVRVWLAIQALEPDTRQALLMTMSPAEKYWYTELFPRWINEPDPKIFEWKKKLMDGQDFDDEELINDLRNRIDNERGSSWACYILDLSMATDLIVSGELEQPLCVQLTTLRPQLCLEKKGKWEITLGYWKIQWGLFVSFNPMKERATLVSRVLQESDRLPASGYNEIEI